jgi:DNA mismatch repair protein MutS
MSQDLPEVKATAELTPMLRHYMELKTRHPDALLLYRMGDFYEAFFDDALRIAPLLEITLTARHRGTDSETPMCGVPHHALEPYLAKLLRAGLKVAICDQVEDPALTKGTKELVRREITRVMTPGTLADPGLMDGREDALLAALAEASGVETPAAGTPAAGTPRAGRSGSGLSATAESARWALALFDASTGALSVRRFRDLETCREELSALRVKELLLHGDPLPAAPVAAAVAVPGVLGGIASLAAWAESAGICVTRLDREVWPESRGAAQGLRRRFDVQSLRGFGLDDGEAAVVAAAAALDYAQRMQQRELPHVRELVVREDRDALWMDAATLANLEVLENARDGARKASLLGTVDRTLTSPGARRVRDWLRRPLRDPEAIRRRLRAVAELVERADVRNGVRDRLRRLADLERLAGRVALRTLTPREAAALRDSLAEAPGILAQLSATSAPLLAELASVDFLPALHAELGRWLLATPAALLTDGGVIADGVDAELDQVRSLARDSKQHILGLEARERERTGIASLKIRYNKVFGYTIEISKSQQTKVPDDYERRQTLVNAERYVTPEVKRLEESILGAEERQIVLETQHFAALRERAAADLDALRALARVMATVDVLASFADVAVRGGWCEPKIGDAGGALKLRDSRHPVVEALLPEGKQGFVPNDAELDPDTSQLVILTGPNMGGKSTYLRQVALAVVLAQAGSFVPAEAAELGVVDRIFTRVGASDDLARGESTFMVEMIETANILRSATAQSLVVLDEVGRGTATFDGLSLAWAVAEHLHNTTRAKTLFATHYHELTELAGYLPRAVNRTMAVREWKDRIVFLRRVVPGSADKSYGLHVARLAGLPRSVLERAAAVLANLESHEFDPTGHPRIAEGGPPVEGPAQLGLFHGADELVLRLLREVAIDDLSPLAALNLLASLRDRLDGGSSDEPADSSSAPRVK